MSNILCEPGCCRYDTTTDTCIYCRNTRPICNHVWSGDSARCKKCHLTWDMYLASKSYSMCDCGAEAAGFNTHAHWCSKAELK